MAVVIVAVAVGAMLTIDQQDAEYPAGSPEAAFQAYLRAWESGDADLAWAALSSRAQEQIPLDRFRSANAHQPDDAHSIWIDDVIRHDERVVLLLAIESLSEDGLLRRDRERASARMTLVRENDDWKIDSPASGYRW